MTRWVNFTSLFSTSFRCQGGRDSYSTWSFASFFAGVGEGLEVGGEGDARKLALEIGGVAGTVFGVVEEGVDVVEDLVFGDGGVAIVCAECFYGGVF